MSLRFWFSRAAGYTTILLGVLLVSQAGAQTNRLNLIRVPAVGHPVKASLDADGAIHLLLDSPEGPIYLKSPDGGRTFNDPITIVDAASQRPGLIFSGEDIAIGANGRVHVAMSNNAWKLKLPQEDWGLYYASLAPGAKAFSPVRNLNRKPSEGFSLAASGRGDVAAWFLSGKLYTMNSRDGGETFTAFAEPDPAWSPCECCTTSLAYGADGKLAMLYRERTDNERDMFVVILDQLGASKPLRNRISDTLWKIEACPMTYFTINRANHGYVAAWPTKGRVYFARLDRDGQVLPPGEIKTPGTSGMRNHLLAVTASDGVTLVAWKHDDLLGWQTYDATGQPQGTPASANSPGSGAAGVAMSDGRFLLFP